MLDVGKNLCANDSDGELGNLKSALGCIVSYKQEEKFKNHQDVIDLFDKVESEIKAFIKKFDKSEPAGDSKVSQ